MARKMKKRGDRVIPKNVKKAFAVATYIATALNAFEEVDSPYSQELSKLNLQANRAMRVFNVKVGQRTYWELSEPIRKTWELLSHRSDATIERDSMPILIELLCGLISPKDFKAFLGVSPYSRDRHLYMVQYPLIARASLELDRELNMLYGTKPYTLPLKEKRLSPTKKEKSTQEHKPKKDNTSTPKRKCQRKVAKFIQKREAHKKTLSKLEIIVKEAKARAKIEGSA